MGGFVRPDRGSCRSLDCGRQGQRFVSGLQQVMVRKPTARQATHACNMSMAVASESMFDPALRLVVFGVRLGSERLFLFPYCSFLVEGRSVIRKMCRKVMPRIT